MRLNVLVLATGAVVIGAMFVLMPAYADRGPASLEAASQAPLPSLEPSVQGPHRVVVTDLSAPDARAAGATDTSVPPRRLAPKGARSNASSDDVPEVNASDGGAAGASGAPTIASSFAGLSNADTAAGLTPPDPQVAVGPDHVVEFVNTLGRVYNRTGSTIDTFALVDFFGVPADHHDTDPQLVYDTLSGRWLASYASFHDTADTDEGRLYLAVSETDDPTGAWDVYTVLYTNTLPDFPGLGLTNDKVTVSSNVFDVDGPPGAVSAGCSDFDGFCGVQTIVFEKADLLAGVPAGQLGKHTFALDQNLGTVRPAQSLSSAADQYLTTWDLSSLNTLTVLKITGTPDAANVAQTVAAGITTVNQLDPPPSRTAGTAFCFVRELSFVAPPCIDSGDYRTLDVVWRDNHLWTSSSASCFPSGEAVVRSCAHLVEANTSGTPSLAQDIMFGASGNFYSWPAVSTDASNNLYVSMTHTNTSVFAEAVIGGRRTSDPANTLGGTSVLRAGDVEHISGRWGDYLGAAVDPEHTNCVWVAGEFALDTAGADWGTYIAATAYSGACAASPPTSTPHPGATPTPTRTPHPQVTPPEFVFGDANCDGIANAIDALFVLQFYARLLLSLPCEQLAHADTNGVLNAIDATLILQFDAGIIPQLPVQT